MVETIGSARRIAAELRRRINDGRLRPGARVPSTRQLVRDWGVAMATASRAIAILRDEGLVITRPGSGTTVCKGGPSRTVDTAGRGLTRKQIVAAGIAIADGEGLAAVSMRRLSGQLQVTPMSLYHHIAGRDELEFLMVRSVFASNPLPKPAPQGWRARLEAVYRLQWRLYRKHPWLVELMPVARPPLVPEAMDHSEWTLQALAELELGPRERMRAALALPSLVRGHALGVLGEIRAERETRLRSDQWWRMVDGEIEALLRTGRYPRIAAVDEPAAAGAFGLEGVDDVFHHALTRYLDGLAAK